MSYSRTGGNYIKTIFDGRTNVCCKKLGWFL